MRTRLRSRGRERASRGAQQRGDGSGRSGNQKEIQSRRNGARGGSRGHGEPRRARTEMRRRGRAREQRRRDPPRQSHAGERRTLAQGVGPEGLRLLQSHARDLQGDVRARLGRRREHHWGRRRKPPFELHRRHDRKRVADCLSRGRSAARAWITACVSSASIPDAS